MRGVGEGGVFGLAGGVFELAVLFFYIDSSTLLDDYKHKILQWYATNIATLISTCITAITCFYWVRKLNNETAAYSL